MSSIKGFFCWKNENLGFKWSKLIKLTRLAKKWTRFARIGDKNCQGLIKIREIVGYNNDQIWQESSRNLLIKRSNTLTLLINTLNR